MEPRNVTQRWVGEEKRADSERESSYTYSPRKKDLTVTLKQKNDIEKQLLHSEEIG